MCTKPVPLVDPLLRQEFLDGLKQSVEVAMLLKCPNLIVLSGDEIQGVSRKEQLQSIIEGLRASIPLLEGTGIKLILEPLNTIVDHKGYFLSTSAETVEIIDAVSSESVKLLYDVYHQQITEGNLIPNISAYLNRIGYIHIADHPGRHEPGTGEINYSNVLAVLRKLGYDGYIGLEFEPTTDAKTALRAFAEAYN